jgi:hypothetical protein
MPDSRSPVPRYDSAALSELMGFGDVCDFDAKHAD